MRAIYISLQVRIVALNLFPLTWLDLLCFCVWVWVLVFLWFIIHYYKAVIFLWWLRWKSNFGKDFHQTRTHFHSLSRCFCHNYWRKSLKFIQFMWFIRWIKLFLLELFQENLAQHHFRDFSFSIWYIIWWFLKSIAHFHIFWKIHSHYTICWIM